jgi:adenosylcobyric acid synthase
MYEKKTVQARKKVTGGGPILEKIRGQEVCGYEIHMGVTIHSEERAFSDDGAVAAKGLIIGTYLHGIFENENFQRAFLDYLYSRRSSGQKSNKGEGREIKAETSERKDVYDDLALAVESNLDMDKILKMLRLA